jgi:general secretion pathway protein G
MAKHGFTLIEILIVVIILGFLAAIVIPQVSNASSEARISSLCSDLQVIRFAIELYKVQHGDTLPGSTAGVSFGQAMTQRTDEDGTVNAAGRYGPYVQNLPVNPFNGLDTVEVEDSDNSVSGGNCGWHFNSSTGQFRADTDEHTGM